MEKKRRRKRRHSKTKYYILAALSYLINYFAVGLVITEAGKNQLKKHTFFAVNSKVLPVYTVIAALLMFIFYYKRYIKRKHFRKKTKIQAWACAIIHIIHPVFFAFWQNSILFLLFFIDCLFLTLNPPRTPQSVLGGYIAVVAKFLLAACCVFCPAFFACFLLGMGIMPVNIMVLHAIAFLIYSLLYTEYKTSY